MLPGSKGTVVHGRAATPVLYEAVRENLATLGGFAPSAQLRLFLLPQAREEPGLEEESPAFAATEEEPRKERTSRWDWAGLLRRTFALDVSA